MSLEDLSSFSTRVVTYLKTNGKFDEFRKLCSNEIEQHRAFLKTKREIEDIVRMRVVDNLKSEYPLTKNQLRQEIRVMLNRRKELITAADAAIHFSLDAYRPLFISEISKVATQFEEEEKEKEIEKEKEVEREREAEKEREALEEEEAKLRLAEEEAKLKLEEEDEIPPPPPPPPPVRQPLKPVSDNDTALLMQESAFTDSMFCVPHSSVNINDLLSKVNSSDFMDKSPEAKSTIQTPAQEDTHSVPPSTSPIENEDNKLLYESSTEPSTSISEISHEPYSYTESSDRHKSESRRSHRSDFGYADYVEREKSRSEHRKRSKHSKHSPHYLKEYEKYLRYKEKSKSRRDSDIDWEYYKLGSRSSSSSRATTSREYKKREEEWYAKYYGSRLSSKYFQYREEYEYLKAKTHKHKKKSKHDREEYYLSYRSPSRKSSYRDESFSYSYESDFIKSERSKSKRDDYLSKTTSASSYDVNKDYYPLLDTQSKSPLAKKSGSYSEYDRNSKTPDYPINRTPTPKETHDQQIANLENTFEDSSSNAIDNITPPKPESHDACEEKEQSGIEKLLEKVIQNIPKTPEEPLLESSSLPLSLIQSGGEIETQTSPICAEPLAITSCSTSATKSLIDSILPKPKYCSILKENYGEDSNEADTKLESCQLSDTNYEEKTENQISERDETSPVSLPRHMENVVPAVPKTPPTPPSPDQSPPQTLSSLSSLSLLRNEDQKQVEGCVQSPRLTEDAVQDLKRPTPQTPVILTTSRMPRKNKSEGDTEEGEILSDYDETNPGKKSNKVNKYSPYKDPQKPSISDNYEESLQSDFSKQDSNSRLSENIIIKSKRDLFKARYFQPDLKVEFANPTIPNILSDEEIKQEINDESVKKEAPVVDVSRYSRAGRFKEVLQQHMNEPVLNEDIPSQLNAESLGELKSEQLDDALSEEQKSSEFQDLKMKSESHDESSTMNFSILGKRKRFLNDYIASLETHPPKSDDADIANENQESTATSSELPKLRIKPTDSGSFSSETLPTSGCPEPPPLHLKEGVPKCVIKFGKDAWNSRDKQSNKPSTRRMAGKRKLSQKKSSLRSRESSIDSAKSGGVLELRSSRSSRSKTAKTTNFQVDENEKSDNSFEDVDSRSRKSSRTRKSIKRLNL